MLFKEVVISGFYTQKIGSNIQRTTLTEGIAFEKKTSNRERKSKHDPPKIEN